MRKTSVCWCRCPRRNHNFTARRMSFCPVGRFFAHPFPQGKHRTFCLYIPENVFRTSFRLFPTVYTLCRLEFFLLMWKTPWKMWTMAVENPVEYVENPGETVESAFDAHWSIKLCKPQSTTAGKFSLRSSCRRCRHTNKRKTGDDRSEPSPVFVIMHARFSPSCFHPREIRCRR